MAEGNAAKHLKDVCPRCLLVQPAVRGLQLVQNGVVHVLEHQVKATLAAEKLDQVYQVLMTEFLRKKGKEIIEDSYLGICIGNAKNIFEVFVSNDLSFMVLNFLFLSFFLFLFVYMIVSMR